MSPQFSSAWINNKKKLESVELYLKKISITKIHYTSKKRYYPKNQLAKGIQINMNELVWTFVSLAMIEYRPKRICGCPLLPTGVVGIMEKSYN